MCYDWEGDSVWFCIPISLCLTGNVKLIRGDSQKQCQRGHPHHNPLSQSARGTGCYTHHFQPSVWLHLTIDNLLINKISGYFRTVCCILCALCRKFAKPYYTPLIENSWRLLWRCQYTNDLSPSFHRWSMIKEPTITMWPAVMGTITMKQVILLMLLYCNLHVFITALLVSCILMIVPTMAE